MERSRTEEKKNFSNTLENAYELFTTAFVFGVGATLGVTLVLTIVGTVLNNDKLK